MSTTDTQSRPGVKTTEFWATMIVNTVLILNATFGLGIDISDETAMQIAGGITAAYGFSRSLPKAFSR